MEIVPSYDNFTGNIPGDSPDDVQLGTIDRVHRLVHRIRIISCIVNGVLYPHPVAQELSHGTVAHRAVDNSVITHIIHPFFIIACRTHIFLVAQGICQNSYFILRVYFSHCRCPGIADRLPDTDPLHRPIGRFIFPVNLRDSAVGFLPDMILYRVVTGYFKKTGLVRDIKSCLFGTVIINHLILRNGIIPEQFPSLLEFVIIIMGQIQHIRNPVRNFPLKYL